MILNTMHAKINFSLLKQYGAIVLVYVFILAIFLFKTRFVLADPRLWYEEGIVYLRDSVLNGFSSVFSNHQGYYSIIPSVTIYLSSLFSTKYIPYFTVYTSLFFWCYLFYEIFLYVNNKYKTDNISKVLFVLTIFLIIASGQEILLNTITLQFITPFIIYFIIKNHQELSVPSQVLILICLLNGVMGLLFIPLLYVKYLKKYKILFLFIAVGVLFHLYSVLFYTSDNRTTVMQRLVWNLSYKIQLIEDKDYLKFLYKNYYLIFFATLCFYRKMNREKLITVITLLGITIFVDLTRVLPNLDSERYNCIITGSSFLVLCELINVGISSKLQLPLLTLSFLLICIKSPRLLYSDYIYCKEASWKKEYIKYDSYLPAKIHPCGLTIEKPKKSDQ